MKHMTGTKKEGRLPNFRARAGAAPLKLLSRPAPTYPIGNNFRARAGAAPLKHEVG